MTRRRDPRILLLDIEQTAAQIEEFTGDMELGALLGDELRQRALEGGFVELGQALARLRRHSPELAALLALKRLPQALAQAEHAEQLLREAGQADAAGLWRRAREEAPEVRQAVRSLLDELDREARDNRDQPTPPAEPEAGNPSGPTM